MDRLDGAMWGALSLVAWTHAGYPVAAACMARRAPYRSRGDAGHLPSVALVIAVHNEERAIRARLDNALGLDYPSGLLEVVLSLDGCTDGTARVAAAYASRGVRVLDNPRGGKVAAQNAAVRATRSDVVAFSDANSLWDPGALRALVRQLADPGVGYVCGRLRLVDRTDGHSVEGRYWRYELWLRARESLLGSITAGNGAIYAVRRAAHVELAPHQSHDIGLPFRLRRGGLRSLYEPDAVAREPVTATSSGEWERKVRMISRAWHDVLCGGMLDPRGLPPRFVFALLSHRLLRYASGPLHVVALASALGSASHHRPAGRAVVAAHGLWLGLALRGRRTPAPDPASALAWYYLLVTGASLAGLARLARSGPPAPWAPVREA